MFPLINFFFTIFRPLGSLYVQLVCFVINPKLHVLGCLLAVSLNKDTCTSFFFFLRTMYFKKKFDQFTLILHLKKKYAPRKLVKINIDSDVILSLKVKDNSKADVF